ncbi:MAG: hypothetical protein AAGE80_05255 [Pseudomonadota bacterium]
MKYSIRICCCFFAISVLIDGLLASATDDVTYRGVFSSPAAAQVSVDDCREIFAPGSLREVKLFRCNDGRFYKRDGEQLVETDSRGNVIVAAPEEPAPPEEEVEVQETALKPATPDFKSVPTAGSQPAVLDTSRPDFKKVPTRP